MPALTPADRLLVALRAERGDRLRVGFVSDVHGQHKRPALELFVQEAAPDLLVCAGDLQDYRGGYGVPMLFIRGNHECWSVLDRMASGDYAPPGLAQIPDGVPVTIAGVRVVGAGGAWSDAGKGQRKHLTQAHLDELGRHRADIVLTHETPIVFSNGNVGRGGGSRTLEPLRELAQLMEPRLWFSGHHHHWDTETLGRTRIVSLGKWPDEWAIVEFDHGSVGEMTRWTPRRDAYPKLKERWRGHEAQEKELLFRLDRAGRLYGTDEPGMPQFRKS